MNSGTPVPDEVAEELQRVARRWQQLPLGHALRHAPALRQLAQQVADTSAAALGQPPTLLPDLGPAVALDQLLVTVFDACDSTTYPVAQLCEQVRSLRRSLS